MYEYCRHWIITKVLNMIFLLIKINLFSLTLCKSLIKLQQLSDSLGMDMAHIQFLCKVFRKKEKKKERKKKGLCQVVIFFDRLLHSLTEYEEKNCKSTAKLRIATSLKCGKVQSIFQMGMKKRIERVHIIVLQSLNFRKIQKLFQLLHSR